MEDYIRNAVVNNIHDGDTITVTIDLGYRVTYITPLRFNGINAPELRTEKGKLAKAYLQTLIKVGDTIIIKTHKNPLDKYGRWLADVYTIDNKSINDLMVTSKNALYWDGQGVKPV